MQNLKLVLSEILKSFAMGDKNNKYKKEENDVFSRQVGQKENLKLKASKEDKRSAWSGLGVVGMIGWTVAVPTLLGIALGIWLDKKYPQTFSWTLTFMILGLILGCILAWQWVDKEKQAMQQPKEKKR